MSNVPWNTSLYSYCRYQIANCVNTSCLLCVYRPVAQRGVLFYIVKSYMRREVHCFVSHRVIVSPVSESSWESPCRTRTTSPRPSSRTWSGLSPTTWSEPRLRAGPQLCIDYRNQSWVFMKVMDISHKGSDTFLSRGWAPRYPTWINELMGFIFSHLKNDSFEWQFCSCKIELSYRGKIPI